MAVNLREKIPASDTLMVLDINTQMVQCFVDDDPETGKSGVARIQTAGSARELAEECVSIETPQGGWNESRNDAFKDIANIASLQTERHCHKPSITKRRSNCLQRNAPRR